MMMMVVVVVAVACGIRSNLIPSTGHGVGKSEIRLMTSVLV